MILSVHYNGMEVGGLADSTADGNIYFEYNGDWIDKGIEISPINLPTTTAGVTSNPDDEFSRLHGVFWDSLPDHWGHLLLNEQLRLNGVDPDRVSALVRLSYLGERTMGALTYHPQSGDRQEIEAIDLAAADHAAQLVLDSEDTLPAETYLPLILAGSSAGGAKPKITTLFNPSTGDVGKADGATPWIIKLSGLPDSNKDSRQGGMIEYAYSIMAAKAGIEMARTHLIRAKSQRGKDRWFFATERFDRKAGERIHMHSFAGLTQLPINHPTHSYEHLLRIALELTRNYQVTDQLFRRMVFNILAGNCDDHARNFAFLMDSSGNWSLSPAYDITNSPGPNNRAFHCLSVLGNSRPGKEALHEFAKEASINNARDIIDEVSEAVNLWPSLGKELGVRAANITRIQDSLESIRK